MEKLEQRMYCLVLRHLSGINKGIQCTHACEQYGEMYHNTPEYRQYIEEDKTLIMLDAGTAPDMDFIEQQLIEAGVKHYAFKEPDLNNLNTAICFLADEKIWDRTKYFDYDDFIEEHIDDEDYANEDLDAVWIDYIGGKENLVKIYCIRGKRLAV